ncbi:hypothetical protein NVP1144O_74 [Vibrio phage 1.144.O._10N.286.45.B3]|nr:hypothetical protein NVP1144O_74 [Vibrio phage 1.144.O._10N.286.45.B3]
MITCKEDLIDTYIKNDGGELRDLYISKLKEFGVRVCGGDGFEYLYRKSFIGVRCWGEGGQSEWNNTPFKKAKELTMKDLVKPKTTKFVKVEESIFDLKEEFERGELYSSNCEGHYTQLKYKKSLYLAAHQDSIYRQVEIDWRDEVKSKYSLTDFRNLDDGGCINLGDWTPEGFIKLCHFVAELTDKPE